MGCMKYTDTDEQLPVTATHEAGHVAASWLAGIRVFRAGLVPTGVSDLGHVLLDGEVRYTSHSRHLVDVVVCDDDSEIVSLVGGVVAEKVFEVGDPERRRIGASNDLEKALCHAGVLLRRSGEIPRFIFR